jgi:TPR repeat protein
LFGAGLGLVLAGQVLHARQSEADRQAMAQLRTKAEAGDAQAQFELGKTFRWGNFGVATNCVEAVKRFRKAAEQNHPEAQNDLGCTYYQGNGVATHYVEAESWFRKAAEQNVAEAQHGLGVCYRDGRGVTKDVVQAVKWFRQAAGQNFAPAQNDLGVCYANGLGLTKDHVEAYKWWLLAAAQGDELARNATPKLERFMRREQIAQGQKLASDFKPPEAPSLDAQQGLADSQPLADLRTKAATGDAQAQNELGEALFAGKRGVAKNAAEAVKWWRKAADQNHPAAQYHLAVGYERGDGVAKYEVEAYKWYRLAAKQGDRKAQRNATMLELTMSRDEIEEGKRRESTWLDQRKTPSPKAQ